MLARLASCCVGCVSLAAIFAPHLCAQTPKTAEKTKDTFAGKKAGDEWDGNGLKMKFCWCPPGKFTMGSPEDERNRETNEAQVSVTLTRGFWLGKYEVTQGEWKRIMGTTVHEQRAKKPNEREAVSGEGANYPMYYVNFEEATDFCGKLTEQERRAGALPAGWEYRLPTEAQWEYACRAGTKTATAFGDKLGSDQANFNGEYPYNGADKGKSLKRTTTVGRYKANAWGLCDMHGNVCEWCRDWGNPRMPLPGGVDPEQTEKTYIHVYRGGSWYDGGWDSRSAARILMAAPEYRRHHIGFRVAAVQVSK